MPTKRKRKTRITETVSQWRRQHGDISEPTRDMDPETGAHVTHRRAVDLLTRMMNNGTITAEMRDAGAAFHANFRRAALDLPARSLLRSSKGQGLDLTDRIIHARQRVSDALDAVGGPASPAGSCLWHVVGCECSIREWAARQGWAGRIIGHTQAQGILIAALGILAAWQTRPAKRC